MIFTRFSHLNCYFDENHLRLIYLKDDVGHNDEKWISQVDNEPQLDGFYRGGAGKVDRHGDVDRGEHHHAGDVDGVDHVILVLGFYIICSLVYSVHENA